LEKFYPEKIEGTIPTIEEIENELNIYHGRAQAIVKLPQGVKTPVIITAKGNGINEAKLKLR